MPLVFVHGVNNRMGSGYQEAVAARDALFRRFTLGALTPAPAAATIENPYWGDRGADFRWGLASLPTDDDAQSLGLAEGDPEMAPLAAAVAARAAEFGAAGGPADIPPGEVLLASARADFPGTVDLLVAAGAVEADDEADGFAETAARAAAYADAHPQRPGWVAEVGSDEEFLDRLQTEVDATVPTVAGPPVESLGIGDLWDAIRSGADRLKTAAGDVVGSKAYALVRKHVAPTLATFIGDVFTYLGARGTPAAPGDLVRAVVDGLRRAADAVDPEKDPFLVVVGHSLGGVISYDVLTSFVPELKVDALVTVGSQVGLFEELKLFLASDRAVPGNGVTKLRRPGNVRSWVNVFDRNDLLSFRLAPLVDGVDEFRFASGELLTAHGAYFGAPRFHERLAVRLSELLLP
jgi:hypothetical protein